MRIRHQSYETFKNSRLIADPRIAVVSLAAWKSGKFLADLPAALRDRVKAVSARLQEPLAAGGRLRVQGLARNEGDLVVALLPDEADTFHLLEFARDAVKDAVLTSTKVLELVIAEHGDAERIADAFGSALAARIFLMPVFGKRSAKRKAFQLREVVVVSRARKTTESLERGRIAGEGTNLARYLAMLPPNFLDPAEYGRRIRELCRQHSLGLKFYSSRELKRMGAGAFVAVDQGNPKSAGGIYELSYNPRSGARRKPVHLVGKGLCFDTGGYDVKIQSGMMRMKGDMQGSAVALATLIAASELKLPLRMKAYLAITENHLSPESFTPDEVVTALNGLSIEVINTDAEGRMVLADTLTLASREKPACVIDFATLTGSAVRSLGTMYSAGFTNRQELHESIVGAGAKSGERVWTFPLDATYQKALESSIADTVQCLKGPGPDHIYAACFLSKFVNEGTPWVHVDLSASEHDCGLAHVDSTFTGFGVRWTLEFLQRYL